MSNLKSKVVHLNNECRIDNSRVGRIVRVDATGNVFVDYDANPFGPIPARLCGDVCRKIVSSSTQDELAVLMVFENGQADRPIVVDVLLDRLFEAALPESAEEPLTVEVPPDETLLRDAVVDGKQIRFNAEEQIVLKCGKSSITLTQNGKVLIRGAYVLNRSTGVNHIKGGSVKIN